MKKYFFIIIGLGLWASFTPPIHAQELSNDCENTLYEDEFRCQSKSVFSYCSSTRDKSAINIYGKTYCDLSQSSDDAIFDALLAQFKLQDPKYTIDQLKYLLFGMNKQSIQDFLQEKYGNRNATDKLPESVQNAFFKKGSLYDQSKIQERIRTAYNQQKVIDQTQKSLQAQFESREIWSNGNLNDSPFDLVVDLNLIEQVLFGSKAGWLKQNDVWSWPENKADQALIDKEKQNNKNTSTNTNQNKEKNPAIPSADDYECKPKDQVDEPVGKTPTNCGNGQKDPGETCDDGNLKAGDGCSNTCQKEPGADLMCIDIEAVNFKTFEAKTQSDSGESRNGNSSSKTPPINCPEGTVPIKKEAPQNKTPQSPNYPGPFVGGVLKQFPPSNRPRCPAGTTWAEVKVLGKSYGQCFADQFCFVDFNEARSFLYDSFKQNLPKEEGKAMPDKWEDVSEDHPANAVLGAIEARICVNVRKVNRPASPYKPSEGCIDCHVLAMNDAMKKLLSKNVAPMQTPMQAFGISNRWGPTFSFNFNAVTTMLKNAVFQPKYTAIETKKRADQLILTYKNNKPLKPAFNTTGSVATFLADTVKKQDQQKEEYYRNLRQFYFANEGNAARNTVNPLNGLLLDFKNSFERIQAQYQQIATSAKFAEKRQCTFK